MSLVQRRVALVVLSATIGLPLAATPRCADAQQPGMASQPAAPPATEAAPAPVTSAAPLVPPTPPTAPPPPPRSSLASIVKLGVTGALPMGDQRFGLQPFDADAVEFSPGAGLHISAGLLPTALPIVVGLRADLAFAALQSDKWGDALGVEVGASLLVDVGMFAAFHYDSGPWSMQVGLDGGYTSLGTAAERSDDGSSPRQTIDHTVSYSAMSGAAFLTLMRSFDGRPNSSFRWFVQGRYARRTWRSLEADGPSKLPALRSDVEQMSVDHIWVVVGLCGVIQISGS